MEASKQALIGYGRIPALRLAIVVGCCLSGHPLLARADIFRCIGADGTTTLSDHPCEPAKPDGTPPASGGSRAGGGSDIYEQRASTPREKKAAQILNVLRIAPAEPEAMLVNRTVDDAAPDLVKSIDPDNALWTPANVRWHSVSDFVKADLRRDAQGALRASTAEVSRIADRLYAERTTDADIDALSKFLGSPEGTRYLAFQNEIRPLLYAALSSLENQEPMPESVSSEKVLAQRRQLLTMALEVCIARSRTTPATTSTPLPGSNTVLENAVRREGATLDTIFDEYEPFLPSLRAFAESDMAKRLYLAAEPALRTQLALSSTATTDFAEQEFDKYLQRWRGYYGPMRTTTRTTVMIRGRTVLIAHAVTTRILPGTQSPEAMAIQCENRENALYLATHRNVDYNTRAAALKGIQGACRAEQRLPAL